MEQHNRPAIKNTPPSTVPEDSLMRSEEPATAAHPEPAESFPLPYILFSQHPVNITVTSTPQSLCNIL